MNSIPAATFSTPARKKLNATYATSAVRPTLSQTSVSQKIIYAERNDALKELGLHNTQWEAYRINALYGFLYQKPILFRHEKKLESLLEADVRNVGSDSLRDLRFAVTIQYYPNLVFADNDFPPVKIIIESEDAEESDVQFIGILLSVERKEGFMEQKRKDAQAVILPLFLAAYKERVLFESVKYYLEDNFSCLVSPLIFSSHDLIWMLALFSPKGSDSAGMTEIEYSCPAELGEELQTMQFTVEHYTVIQIWKKIMEPNASTISNTEVYKFIQMLENHFFNAFQINLSELNIHSIRTPLAIAKADNSIWLSNTNKLYFVMRHLTHLSQEILS